jgi:hypothetical protein
MNIWWPDQLDYGLAVKYCCKPARARLMWEVPLPAPECAKFKDYDKFPRIDFPTESCKS